MAESFNTGKHFLSTTGSSQRSGLQIKVSITCICFLLCEILKNFTKSPKIYRILLVLFPRSA